MHFIEPKFQEDHFTCPHCGTVAGMRWDPAKNPLDLSYRGQPDPRVCAAFCRACDQPSIWLDGKMVYPDVLGIEPHSDMPDKARVIFCEAQAVSGKSPRAACALLRLCLEVIVSDLGGKGNTLYERIESLKLPPDLEDVFRACRIVGNQASHPGEINFGPQEGKELAVTLSNFINLIVLILIAPKRQIQRVREVVKF